MMLPRILSIALLIALAAHSLQAKTIYVDEMADSPAAPHGTWGTATNKLQTAISSAVDGDQIWVAAGTYYPDEGHGQTADDRTATFRLVNGVEIYGGFKGDERELTAADPISNPTILSGDIGVEADSSDNSYHILTAETVGGSALLQGFTITGGNADGVYPYSQGSALFCDGASPTIIDCTFVKNSAEDYGGAIYNNFSSPTFTNCSFQQNSAKDFGGAIYNNQSSPFLTNCVFQGNYSNYQAGALYNYQSSPLVTNCTFQGNKAKFDGGAIHNSSSTPSFVNTIIWYNESKGATNTPAASISSDGTGSPSFSYSLVDNYSKAALDAGASPGTNFPPADPRFILSTDPNVAPSLSGNLRLRVGSPALDEGDNAANTTTGDIAGNTRILANTIDLGAYEGALLTINVWIQKEATAVDADTLALEIELDYELDEIPQALLDSIVQSTIGSATYTSITTSGSGYTHTLRFNGLSGEGLLTIAVDTDLAKEKGIIFLGESSYSTTIKSSESKVHYVNRANTDSQFPYDTWATASNNLQDALNWAVSGDQIWVARGTYYPDEGELQTDNDRAESFQLKSGISIYGGFIGGETDISEADSDKNIITLSGEIQQDSDFSNNSYHVVTVLNTNGGAQPLIQGIYIASGYADGLESLKFNRGGGLYCFNSSPQIRDVWFYDNFAQRGGAVFNESSSSPTFERTILLRNSAQEGGAMYNSSASSPELENCFILGNQANLGGGALFNFDRSAPMLTNCIIRGNRATNQQGGAIKNDNASPRLVNCSIQGNRAGDEGGALYNFNISSPELVNCIIWNNQSNDFTNQPTSSVYNESGSVPSYSYCLVENYSKATLDAGTSPNTNLAPEDPRFVLPADLSSTPTRVGDLSLKYGSPAIDKGDSSDPTAFDLFGSDRIQNSIIDLGAVEGAHISVTSWQTAAPLATDATALIVKLILDGGTRPSGWKNAIAVSTEGSAIHGGLTVDESDPDFVLLVLSGLSGEGSISLSLDPDMARAEGLIFLGDTSFETPLRSSTASATHYVDATNATPEAPYDTWEKAADNLQDALAYAATGDEVWVAQGTYYPDEGAHQTDGDRYASFQLQNGIAIYGGFAGGETDISSANPLTQPTILSGDIDGDAFDDGGNSYHVVTAESTDESAQLHGFTIQAGYAYDVEDDRTASGGGLFCKDASPTLTFCIFQGNSARDGGAIYIESSSPKLTNCSFSGNTGTSGGAIHNQDASPVLINCSFQANKAFDWGGAVTNRNSSPTFTNCSFQGNHGELDGGAIYNRYASAPVFTNCIIWNNRAGGQTDTQNASIHNSETGIPAEDPSPTFSFCIVENYSKAELDAGDSPNTNFEPADPLFALPADPSLAPFILVPEPGAIQNLRLKYGSPALDKGTNPVPATDFDLAGNPRLINSRIDLGAYEGTVYEIESWVLSNPLEIGANELELTLTLKNGARLPAGWQETLDFVKTGTADFGSSDDVGAGPVYIFTLSGLSGDGKLTIAFDQTQTNAEGFAFKDNIPFEANLRTRPQSPNLYVNAANTRSQAPFDTWETAANKLQDALYYALPGDTVWVAQGTYYPDEGIIPIDGDRTARFNLKSDIAIHGGFAGGETRLSDADPASNFTILSGNIDQGEDNTKNSYHVVLANATNANAILDGFIITGGYADDADSDNAGGGLYCKEGATPTLSNCWFEGNFALFGGAIGNKASSPNIVNCTFKGNIAVYGGAIRNYLASAPTISNSSFQGNTAIEDGGAIYNDAPSINEGGVGSFNPSAPILINCVLQGNSAGGYGGAVFNSRSISDFTNCSFQGNKAVYSGGAIGNDQESSYILKNSIIWNNQAFGSASSKYSSVDAPFGNGTFTYQNSLVENFSKKELDDSSADSNSNLVHADPLFFKETNPADAPSSSANLRLRLTSAAIDAGKNSYNAQEKDLAGNARIRNSVIDLGAYEGASPLITLSGSFTMTVPFGATWSDPGATATDAQGNAVTVTIGGDTVDTTQTQGTFTLTYNATDSFGNVALQVTREVIIVGVINFDSNANNQLSWTAGWILQTSTDLQLWTDLPNAQSPLALSSITDAQRFWRLRKAG